MESTIRISRQDQAQRDEFTRENARAKTRQQYWSIPDVDFGQIIVHFWNHQAKIDRCKLVLNRGRNSGEIATPCVPVLLHPVTSRENLNVFYQFLWRSRVILQCSTHFGNILNVITPSWRKTEPKRYRIDQRCSERNCEVRRKADMSWARVGRQGECATLHFPEIRIVSPFLPNRSQ